MSAQEGIGYIRLGSGAVGKVRWRRSTNRVKWAYCWPIGRTAIRYAKIKPRWLHQIYADQDLTVPVLKADEPNEKGLWWAFDDKLQRVATNDEIISKHPPKKGWTLVDGGEFLKHREHHIETPEDREKKRVEKTKVRQLTRIEKAQKMLLRAQLDEKRAHERVKLWSKRLVDAQRAQVIYALAHPSREGEVEDSSKRAIQEMEVTS